MAAPRLTDLAPKRPDLLPDVDQKYSVYREVVARTVDVFGDKLKATQWLSRRSTDFKGKSPLDDLTDSDFNPAHVLHVLGIEHGVYF